MRKEVNIGVDVSRASREFRGIPIYTKSILREFGQMDLERVNFTLTHYPEDSPDTDFGLTSPRFRKIPYSGEYVPWVRIIQEQVLYPIFQKNERMDVFWHPQNHAQFLTPVGYVLTLHDVLPLSRRSLSQDLDSADVKALYNSRVKTAKMADKVITVSEFSKQEIVEHVGVAPHNIEVIYNGIDHKTFRPNLSEQNTARIKQKYNLPSEYVLSVGSYSPHKNLGTLLTAYSGSELPSKGVGLVMVGPKNDEVYTSDSLSLEAQASAYGCSDIVKMLSPVPIDDLVAIYNGAKVFAIASSYEGFGFPPLEAMACGIPVISSNAASLLEICGNAALYADPNESEDFSEKMNYLLDNETAMKKMTKAGLRQSARFSWETTAKKTMDVLLGIARQ